MPDSDHRSDLRVGFIGLGAMGGRMAQRLLATGYDLTVYNRERERTQFLEKRGAKVAETPGEVAAGVDVLLSSVADDAAVEAVMLGPGGALASARPGTIIVEMSTILPRTSRRLHEAAASRRVSVLDAPVSGSTPQAEQGQLLIFVGGEEEVYNECKPLLAVLGKKSVYMGPAGSGTAMKLCLNALLGVGIQVLAEAIALGLRSGLPRERLLQALGDTAVLSPSQKSKLENARTGEYPPSFPLRLMFKDFALIAERASELSVSMPVAAAAAQACAVEHARQSLVGGDEDFSAMIRTMQQLAGVAEWTTIGHEVTASS
jgi:3-hydroxyisobutyrate dehydrogenase-like beta-hydroxyacid dehydrogenase